MTKSHTPGPWYAHGHTILNSTSRKGDSCRQIANISDMPSDGMTDQELRGNAHLIAAAPDLLAALEALLPHIQVPVGPMGTDPSDPFPLPDYIIAARAAIAKAQGKQS